MSQCEKGAMYSIHTKYDWTRRLFPYVSFRFVSFLSSQDLNRTRTVRYDTHELLYLYRNASLRYRCVGSQTTMTFTRQRDLQYYIIRPATPMND
eukprot:scaffold27794_cov52-Attheya_sp.AAC.1